MTVDLFRPYLAPEAKDAVAAVLTPDEQGRVYLGQGQVVERFERELTTMFVSDVPLLTTNSCTSALDLALHLCGVGAGDMVISTPMTCSASNSPIVTRGARPIWADVDPLTGLIDPESVRQRVAELPLSRLKAILVVDWGGRTCDYNALRQVSDEVGGIPIIEDAAHALLANYRGRPISYMGGNIVCWSTQAIKHLTTGDGGILRVPSHLYERAKLLRWYGLDRTQSDSMRCAQNIAEVGYKYHMNDIAAAIGLANLKHLPDVVYRHRQHARFYHEALAGLPGVTLPPPDAGSSWWLFCLLLPDEESRDGFIHFLGERDIMASPVHARNDKHTGFGGPLPVGTLPGVDAFASRECAIPVGWWLDLDDLWQVVNAIREWSRNYVNTQSAFATATA